MLDSLLRVLPIFGLGALGAVAPEVVRLYRLRLRTPRLHATYFAISVTYAAVAGIFAVYLARPENILSALYVGMGFPSIVAAGRKLGDDAAGSPLSDSSISEEGTLGAQGIRALISAHFKAL